MHPKKLLLSGPTHPENLLLSGPIHPQICFYPVQPTQKPVSWVMAGLYKSRRPDSCPAYQCQLSFWKSDLLAILQAPPKNAPSARQGEGGETDAKVGSGLPGWKSNLCWERKNLHDWKKIPFKRRFYRTDCTCFTGSSFRELIQGAHVGSS